MEFKYLAINGDNVGDSIGSAIATDNHEELSKITGGLKDAHGGIDEWVQSIGGEIVTSSGDEGIYKVPAESIEESALDGIRQKYSESTGTTITIGIGSSMSEASKALIYGKINEKDQVVEYDPSIDEFIASHGEKAEEMPVDEGMEEGSPEMGEEEVSMGEEAPMEEELVDGEMGEQGLEEEMGEELPMEEESLMEEGEESEEELAENPEGKIQDVVGEDLDGDGDLDTMPAQDDPLNQEEAPMEEGEEEMSLEPEGEDRQGAISDMIHANMGEEEEAPMEEGDDNAELKGSIIEALTIFKENKDILEMAQQQNPNLYQGIMSMLGSMIEMAKQLNMNPEQDMANGEVSQELPQSEEVQDEGVEGLEEDLEEEVEGEVEETEEPTEEEEDEEEQKDFENQFKKSELDKLEKFYKEVMKSTLSIKKKIDGKK